MAFTDVLANAPRPQKIAAGIVGLVIVAALGYFMVSPKSAERDVLRQRNEALQAEVAKARVEEAGLRTFRAQADALRRRLELAKGRLPSEREIPGLYRQISDLALQAGLAVALFAPKPAEDKDTVTEIPIAVSAEGTYHQLGGFFSRIGRIPRIVNLGDFRLAGVERPTGTLRADLTLATYLFRPEGSAPRPALPAPRRRGPSATRPPGPRSHTMTADRTGRATRATGSHVAGWLALTLLASGCGGGAPPSPPPAAATPARGGRTATAAAKPGPVALPKEPEPGPSLPPLSYDGKGRRDPFAPIVLAKDKPWGCRSRRSSSRA